MADPVSQARQRLRSRGKGAYHELRTLDVCESCIHFDVRVANAVTIRCRAGKNPAEVELRTPFGENANCPAFKETM